MRRASGLPAFALELIRTPSLSGQERAAAGLVMTEMRALGYEEVEVDELGNVLGVIGPGGGRTVLLDSHLDTVGVTDQDDWSHDPTGELVGGRLYGRGAMDMKGPLAAAVYAAAALRPRLRRGRVVVCASVAEEMVEGAALRPVLERFRPDRVVICEATSLRIAHGQRGRAEVSLEVRGRSTHSSRPDLGVNAADVMVDALAALRTLPEPLHPQLGPGVLVLTDLITRPYPGLSVVPERCLATLDRRTLPGEGAGSVLDPIRRVASAVEARHDGARLEAAIAQDDFTTYTGARVQAPNFAAAWYLEETALPVQEALDGLGDAGLPRALTHYAFCTNGSAAAGLGIPTVGFGPGDESLAHRPDEQVAVADLEAAADGYAAICARLLAGSG